MSYGSFRTLCRRLALPWSNVQMFPKTVPWMVALVVGFADASVSCAVKGACVVVSSDASVKLDAVSMFCGMFFGYFPEICHKWVFARSNLRMLPKTVPQIGIAVVERTDVSVKHAIEDVSMT